MLNIIKAEEYKYDINSERDLSPFGAFGDNDKVTFTVRLYGDVKLLDDIEKVEIVIHKDAWNSGHELFCNFRLNRTNVGEYSIDFDFKDFIKLWDNEVGLFYYHYLICCRDETLTIGGEGKCELEIIKDGIGERQLLIYDGMYRTSKRFSEGIIYHIFVDRFKRSGRCAVKKGAELNEDWNNGIPQYGEYPGDEVSNNVFFGGDLYGIVEKLDYIASLGTKTIYLSPIFDAYSNHKYDTGDYLKVDEMFGGDDALRELCTRVKEKNIDVILDGVFNHTGDDSVYFNKYGRYQSLGAYQSVNSPYYGWYSFKKYPDDYECWWGVKILPKVNGTNEDFSSFVCGDVVEKWMEYGVSGWRLDVADELNEKFIKRFRNTVKKNNPDGVIIGEVWEDASDKVSYGCRRSYLCGEELDSVMNYPLRDAVIDYVKYGSADKLRKNSEGLYRRYPKCTSDNLMNFLGTHDTERILTVLGGKEAGSMSNSELASLKMSGEERETAKRKLKLAYGIIAGMPGVPCVFYGDEAGLEGYRDPFCRKPFPWNSIDTDLFEFYRKIGGIRSSYSVFTDGVLDIKLLDEHVLCYERRPYNGGEDYKIVVCAARDKSVSIRILKNTANGMFKQPSEAYYLNSGNSCCRGYAFILKEGEVAYLKCETDSSAEIEILS